MGLDMYAYVARRDGQRTEFYVGAEYDKAANEFVNKNVEQPREIAYWRKHPNLHGWMQQLWFSKGNSGEFNGDELELTPEDIDALEKAVIHGQLPSTSGFFFGDGADEYYREQDLDFVKEARFYFLAGGRVFYNSSW